MMQDDELFGGPPLPQHQQLAEGEDQQQQLTYLWGTDIALEQFKQQFRQFLDAYRVTKGFEDSLRRAHLVDLRHLDIDFSALKAMNPSLFHQIVTNPTECLRMMSVVLDDLFAGVQQTLIQMNRQARIAQQALASTRASAEANVTNLNDAAAIAENDATSSILVAPRNLPTSVSLRDLSPNHIETLIGVRGLVVRTSKVIPEIRVAFFQCWGCRHTERSVVERGRIMEPVRCARCAKQYSYQLIHNMCLYDDKQLIRVQEAPENLADGETPVTISVVVYGDLVDSVVPGDRVIVTGIYRAAPLKLNANTRIIKSIFRTHLDAAHIEKASRSTQFASSDNVIDFTDTKKIEELRRMARRPDIYQLLLRSLAPAIWGHEDVKRGILCQLFGGCKKKFKHGSFRSELNIIMCGDPGVAKSQLLTQVHAVSPRGVYTSGKGSSSVGLTAFVVKDADTGEFVLEPGALVLSDKGICCIDEFDKMGEETRSVLHEVMEQQTLSIAKAGIIAQLNARTSVLAAANPKESQWNPTMNIVENLQIEPTLLSRFDLIYLLLDKRDEGQDRYLAKHVLAMFMDKSEVTAAAVAAAATATGANSADANNAVNAAAPAVAAEPTDVLDSKTFSAYIAYARECVSPRITPEAHQALAKGYVELRRARGGGKTVTATLRQLESMIRLAEARAKMRYATEVTIDDVAEAKRLISSAIKEAATDPRTGLINLEMFSAPDMSSGKATAETLMIRLERLIESRYISQGKTNASVNELRSALQDSLTASSSGGPRHTIPAQQFLEVLALMADGQAVRSYTSSTVHFANGGGGSGGGGGGGAAAAH